MAADVILPRRRRAITSLPQISGWIEAVTLTREKKSGKGMNRGKRKRRKGKEGTIDPENEFLVIRLCQ